ncbi:hypothetical protein ACWKWU_20205 [Chitinophaga lutea]
MQQENEPRNRRMNVSYRPLGEVVRGIFFILFGVYMLLAERMGWRQLDLNENLVYVIGGILCAYGLFRVYRGVKQLFF